MTEFLRSSQKMRHICLILRFGRWNVGFSDLNFIIVMFRCGAATGGGPDFKGPGRAKRSMHFDHAIGGTIHGGIWAYFERQPGQP